MKGRTWINKLCSRFYKFEDDKSYKRRGGRRSTKVYTRLVRSKLKALFRRQLKEELNETAI